MKDIVDCSPKGKRKHVKSFHFVSQVVFVASGGIANLSESLVTGSILMSLVALNTVCLELSTSVQFNKTLNNSHVA